MVLSDITTSESSLKRFSQICKLFHPHALTLLTSVQLIKKQMGLTNRAVIGRHLRIMKKLNILKKVADGYALSSEGRALYEFIKEENEILLNPYEKIFYFDSLFGEQPHASQFYIFLEAVTVNPQNKSMMIKSYFELILNSPTRIWPRDKLKFGLDAYIRNNKFPRSFTNRFECMEGWLKELGILEGKGNDLRLSTTGEELHARRRDLEILGDIFSFSSIFINKPPYSLPQLTYERDKEMIFDLIKLAYQKFEIPQLRAAALQTIKEWVCITALVDKNFVMEKKTFETFVHNLYDNGKVRSLILGRDGKLAYIVI